jgi:predicted dehydrogenase
MGSTIDEEGPARGERWAPYSIAAACAASPLLEVVAGADLVEARRTAFAEKWGAGIMTYADAGVMLAAEALDMLAITTCATGATADGERVRLAPSTGFRRDTHAELIVAAVEAGVPMVFCEKSIACSAAACRRVAAACGARGTHLNTGLMRRHDPLFAAVRDAVAGGAIGALQAVVAPPSDLMMHGCHVLDTMSFLVGDPGIEAISGELTERGDARVPAYAEARGLPADTGLATLATHRMLRSDPNASFRVKFAGGVEGSTVPMVGLEWELFGTEGSVRITNDGTGVLHRRPAAAGEGTVAGLALAELALPAGAIGATPWAPAPGSDASSMVMLLEELVAAHEGVLPETTGNAAHSTHICEALLAIAESHLHGGALVALPLALPEQDIYICHT